MLNRLHHNDPSKTTILDQNPEPIPINIAVTHTQMPITPSIIVMRMYMHDLVRESF
jgi:hypothetical protein